MSSASSTPDRQTTALLLKLNAIVSGDPTFRGLAAIARDLEAIARAAPREWRSPADRALTLGERGILLPTGIETLDRAMRGGPRTGKRVVIGGAPGACKTTLVVQLGYRWARQGVHVAILAADEEADGLLVRIGQLEELSRDDLEAGDDEVRKLLAERLTQHMPNMMIVDADEEEDATVEAVSEELRRRAAGEPSVLIVDSIQTVRTRESVHADGPRARINAVIATLKMSGKVDGHLVIATCELARAAYRNNSGGTDDLAAFKESGDIEYGMSTALVLRAQKKDNPEDPDRIKVTMPKNRGGQKLPFGLELDTVRCELAEVPLEEVESGDGQGSGARKADALTEKIIKALADGRTLSKNAISSEVGGNKQTCIRAVDELVRSGAVVVDGRGYRLSGPAVPGGSGTGSELPRVPVPDPVPVPPVGEGTVEPDTGPVSGTRLVEHPGHGWFDDEPEVPR